MSDVGPAMALEVMCRLLCGCVRGHATVATGAPHTRAPSAVCHMLCQELRRKPPPPSPLEKWGLGLEGSACVVFGSKVAQASGRSKGSAHCTHGAAAAARSAGSRLIRWQTHGCLASA
jgi:hypothetical protein